MKLITFLALCGKFNNYKEICLVKGGDYKLDKGRNFVLREIKATKVIPVCFNFTLKKQEINCVIYFTSN